jgi:hypothetical protein
MTEQVQFVVNERGERIAAIISVEVYEKMLEKLGNAEAILAFKQARAFGEPGTPAEKGVDRIEPSS